MCFCRVHGCCIRWLSVWGELRTCFVTILYRLADLNRVVIMDSRKRQAAAHLFQKPIILLAGTLSYRWASTTMHRGHFSAPTVPFKSCRGMPYYISHFNTISANLSHVQAPQKSEGIRMAEQSFLLVFVLLEQAGIVSKTTKISP